MTHFCFSEFAGRDPNKEEEEKKNYEERGDKNVVDKVLLLRPHGHL